ncbi:MAG TPA: 3-deoxy-7-phosphoheptulonate synthase [Vicinamibacteria bacterium]|nr:3-deoxy-7-phosphoheptulonate synthase [Vicinamibacteria bacterium]
MNDVRPVAVRDCVIGGPELVVMAGPCAVESREQIFEAAEVVAASGARFLRGGAFKVRTSPAAFQGLGWDGWKLLREAADAYGLRTVSEILDEDQIEGARRHVDLAQIGSRNMQNIPLLRALGRSRMPVLLKRGFGCTIDEWIHAAEYVLREGNEAVVLCERGIRTFETATRFTLDVAAVPIAKGRLGLPVIVDPSHAAGSRDWVECLTLSGVACGGDGLLVETHPEPAKALSDGPQAVVLSEFPALVEKARRVAHALGRTIPARARVAAAC